MMVDLNIKIPLRHVIALAQLCHVTAKLHSGKEDEFVLINNLKSTVSFEDVVKLAKLFVSISLEHQLPPDKNLDNPKTGDGGTEPII